MARPLRIQYPGAVYHVTNRGNERMPIFKNDVDRSQFLKILTQSISTYDIRMHSYVLMSNHYHLLAETPLGNLGEFMRHFNITYTSYFNRTHKRSGHLFQGRYKSFLVEKDAYLSAVSRYIHLNPVKIGGIRMQPPKEQLHYLWSYEWSSLPGYLSAKFSNDFMEYKFVLDEFGGDNEKGRLAYMKQLKADLLGGVPIKEKIVGQSLLGNDDFVSTIKNKYINSKTDRERPAVGVVHRYVATENILKVLSDFLGETIDKLLTKSGVNRQIAMDVLYRLGGLKNPEIGKMMGVDYSTVSQGRKRIQAKADKDKSLRAFIKSIEKRCQE